MCDAHTQVGWNRRRPLAHAPSASLRRKPNTASNLPHSNVAGQLIIKPAIIAADQWCSDELYTFEYPCTNLKVALQTIGSVNRCKDRSLAATGHPHYHGKFPPAITRRKSDDVLSNFPGPRARSV